MLPPPEDMPRSLDQLLAFGAPDADALVDRAGSLSYAALDRATGVVAAALVRRGLKPGDRVASWLTKTRLACILPLAAARARLIHVPVNPLLKRAQVAHILADSGARMLVAGSGRMATLEAEDVPHDCLSVDEGDVPLDGDDVMARGTADPSETVAILYTSGSTGRPKGVMLSHANLWLGAIAVRTYLGLGPDDRTLCVLPLSFDYGQNQLLSTWAAGGAVVPFDYLLPRDVARAVERFGITTLAGVPPLWTQLAEIPWNDAAIASLRRLTNSGGRLSVPLVRRLRGLFPDAALHSMYGLTEAFRSTSLDPALIDAHPDSIGDAIPFADIHVLRADGSPAAIGEPGELVHAGPLVAQGYWRDPERTALRFRSGPGGVAVWSGDTVVRGEDGLLRFVGRDDEMIKTAGNRVSPTEVEEAAVGSGLVREAMACGLADAALGQVIALAVAGPENVEEALAAHLRQELPNFMQPRLIRRFDIFPQTPSGKMDRTKIKAELQS